MFYWPMTDHTFFLTKGSKHIPVTLLLISELTMEDSRITIAHAHYTPTVSISGAWNLNRRVSILGRSCTWIANIIMRNPGEDGLNPETSICRFFHRRERQSSRKTMLPTEGREQKKSGGETHCFFGHKNVTKIVTLRK